MTDARTWIDQVDARTNAATDGPWEPTRHGVETVPPDDLHRFDIMAEQVARTDFTVDAEFIAHARTDLPAATTALRSVLDLHRADHEGRCVEDVEDYPCPTVTAITTALSQEDA